MARHAPRPERAQAKVGHQSPLTRRELLVRASLEEQPGPSEDSSFVADAQRISDLSPRVHMHRRMELGVLLFGGQERHCEGLDFTIVPGDVWLIPFWEPHGWRVVVPESRAVILYFLPSFMGTEMIGEVSWLSLFAVRPRDRPRVQSDEVRRQTLAIGERMWREVMEHRSGWVTMVKADLLQLLTTLYRTWQPEVGIGSRRLADATKLGLLMPALTAIQSQPDSRLTASEAAELCALSPRHFQRLFSQTVGASFRVFRLRTRLTHAQRLLATTSLPISDIARISGFANAGHLDRCFVQHYHCSPSAYRARAARRASEFSG